MTASLAALRLLLGPVLLMQGARVRRDIVRLPEPEGPRAGTAGSGPPLNLLILGDSSAAGVGVDHQDAALSGRLLARLAPRRQVGWRVLAATGWTTAEAQAALDGIANERFDAAVILLGVNDITTETGIGRWLGRYGALLDTLAARNGVRHFYLCGLPPMHRFAALPQPLRWYMGQQARAHDRALAAMAAARPDSIHIPVETDLPAAAAASDGFHPGAPVYDALGRVFAQAILASDPDRATAIPVTADRATEDRATAAPARSPLDRRGARAL